MDSSEEYLLLLCVLKAAQLAQGYNPRRVAAIHAAHFLPFPFLPSPQPQLLSVAHHSVALLSLRATDNEAAVGRFTTTFLKPLPELLVKVCAPSSWSSLPPPLCCGERTSGYPFSRVGWAHAVCWRRPED